MGKDNCGSCKLSDKCWGIYCPSTDEILRLSFSKSIIDYECFAWSYYTEKNCVRRRIKFTRGRRLEHGEISETGFYGLIATKKDFTLRIACSAEEAELLTGCDSRHIEEIFLTPVDIRD